jgi:hypothetical protein
MAIAALPHEEIEGVESNLLTPDRVCPVALRADGRSEQTAEQIRIELAVPSPDLEVAGAMLAVDDLPGIHNPLESPDVGAVRTCGVIDLHTSYLLLENFPYARQMFRPGIFLGSPCQDFVGLRQRKRQIAWAWGWGLRLRSLQGFCFEFPSFQFCDGLRATFRSKRN